MLDNDYMSFDPIPSDRWDTDTYGMTARGFKDYLARCREGHFPNSLNFARKHEVRKAAISGDAIAKVIYTSRWENRPSIGMTGWGGWFAACDELGVDPKGDSFAFEGEPTREDHVLISTIKDLVGSAEVDWTEVRRVAKEAAADVAEKVAIDHCRVKIEVTVPERQQKHGVYDQHEAFPSVLQTVMEQQRVLLHGPRGTGKSRMVSSIAKALGLPFSEISCTNRTTLYDYIGIPNTRTGGFDEHEMLNMYENGGIHFSDEFDNLEPNAAVGLNPFYDGNGHGPVPFRRDNPMAEQHPDFIPIVAMNTLCGPTGEYTGRMKQDAAVMDRFPGLCRIFVGYDENLERRILQDALGLLERIHKLRKKCAKANLPHRIPSTRTVAAAARAVHYRCTEAGRVNGDGKSDDSIMKACMADWTDEERAKVIDDE